MENKEMENQIINFRSSYLLRLIKGDWNPLTPNRLVVSDKFIEYRRRNWFLISVDSEDMHWERIIGVSVDKHLFGATVKIKGTGGKEDGIYLHSVWKSTANKIKEECQKYISVHTQEGAGKAFAEIVANQFAKNNTGNTVSPADELLKYKSMLDQGIINQEEFNQKKKELL
jgi:hypothetical protein